jgi:hypothetical protein
MAWPDINTFLNDITVNQRFRSVCFNRTIYTAVGGGTGDWYDCIQGAGTGGPLTLTGTPGVGLNIMAAFGGIPLGPNVSPYLRRLISASFVSGLGNGAPPAVVMLTDLIHVYRSCALVGTPSTLSSHPVWTGTGDTRMTSALGVQISLTCVNQGLTTPGELNASYLDEAGNAGVTQNQCAPTATTSAGIMWGRTNTSLTRGSPLFVLAPGDLGVQQISSYTIVVGHTSGVGTFLLHRPICTVPFSAISLLGERNFISGLPTFPRVYDDSYLALLVLTTAGATVNGCVISGELNFGWGD